MPLLLFSNKIRDIVVIFVLLTYTVSQSVLLNCCSFKGWVVCFKLNHNLLFHVYILNNSTFIYFGYIFSQSRRLMKYILRVEEFKVKDLYALFSSLKFNSLVSTGKNSIHLCNTEAY